MTIRFPLPLFPPGEWRWAVAGSAIAGGTPVSGPPQTAEASAGGWWTCDYSVANLRSLAQHGAWRAILGQLASGVTIIEVPVLDALQPWPSGIRPARTPFSDTAPFDDESEFTTSPIVATLAADVFMPAYPAPTTAPTVAQIAATQMASLGGGEYFAVIGPSGAVRLHMITSISAKVTVGDVTTYTVSVIPPFREDMPAGTAVDFNDPRCTMKADIGSISDAWASITPPFQAKPKIRFIESGFVVPSEG